MARLPDHLALMLGSLVRIDPGTGAIILVHASAREFLLSSKSGLTEGSDESDQSKVLPIHLDILKMCLENLSNEDEDVVPVGPNQDASEQKFRNKLDQHPFLEYSCIYWIYHIDQLKVRPQLLKDVRSTLDRFLQSEDNVIRWLQMFHFLFESNRRGADASKRILDSVMWDVDKRGSQPLITFFLDNYPSLMKHLGFGDGQRFTRWDRFTHVRKSFDHHDAFGRWFRSPTCFPIVSIAAFFDYEEYLKDLLDDDNDLLNYHGPLRGTPLLWAATADASATLKLLLDRGANMDVAYADTNERPIFRAIRIPGRTHSRAGSYPAAQILADKGASLNFMPDVGGSVDKTALVTLVVSGIDSPGAADLARKLVKRDQVATKPYIERGLILQTAAWYDKPKILGALLEDARIREMVNWQYNGTGALHDACTCNRPEMVKQLVEGGAGLNNLCALNKWTPLHFAVYSGARETILTLLSLNANVEIRAPSGQAAMHMAAEYGLDFNFKVFLDHGFKIDQPNAQGQTALQIALQNSHHRLATKLLDLGADKNKISKNVLRLADLRDLDPRLKEHRDKNFESCWTYELAYRMKKSKKLPIPVIARIFRHLGLYETMEAKRTGEITINESTTLHGGEQRGYVLTRPIFGAARNPVHKIGIKLNSRCQVVGAERHWSFFEIKTWNPQRGTLDKWDKEYIFGHNLHRETEKRAELLENRQHDRNHLRRLKPGNRVAVIQRAHYPAWENTALSGSIEMQISVIRDQYKKNEIDQVWKHNRMGGGGGRRKCRPGKCPRCVVERSLGIEVEVRYSKSWDTWKWVGAAGMEDGIPVNGLKS